MNKPTYATVILTIPTEEGFTYRIPAELKPVVNPGIQVIVPFQKRFMSGIVIGIGSDLPAEVS
ncbi:MAG: hypothetical protein EH225_04430, partial [Calditrichaeota bacterium]